MVKFWRWVDIFLAGVQLAIWLMFTWYSFENRSFDFEKFLAVLMGNTIVQGLRFLPKARYRLWFEHLLIRWRVVAIIWGFGVLWVFIGQLARPLFVTEDRAIAPATFIAFLLLISGVIYFADYVHDRATNCLRTPLEWEWLEEGKLSFYRGWFRVKV